MAVAPASETVAVAAAAVWGVSMTEVTVAMTAVSMFVIAKVAAARVMLAAAAVVRVTVVSVVRVTVVPAVRVTAAVAVVHVKVVVVHVMVAAAPASIWLRSAAPVCCERQRPV